MNADFLTDDELKELTGTAQPAAQMRALQKNRVYYFQRIDGKVRVCWHHVHNPLVSAANDEDDINWSALDG